MAWVRKVTWAHASCCAIAATPESEILAVAVYIDCRRGGSWEWALKLPKWKAAELPVWMGRHVGIVADDGVPVKRGRENPSV